MAKKKEHWGWSVAKFTAIAVGGAVAGAYGVRAIDRYFVDKYGRAPFTGGGGAAAGALEEGESDEPVSNPRIQPQAIAPVLPLFPVAPMQIMPPPVMHIAGSGYSAVPSSVPAEVVPARRNGGRRNADETVRKRSEDFEALVAKFDAGAL